MRYIVINQGVMDKSVSYSYNVCRKGWGGHARYSVDVEVAEWLTGRDSS